MFEFTFEAVLIYKLRENKRAIPGIFRKSLEFLDDFEELLDKKKIESRTPMSIHTKYYIIPLKSLLWIFSE